MKNDCIVLGSGGFANEVANYFQSVSSTRELAAWRGSAKTHRDILTIPRGVRLGRLEDFATILKEKKVDRIAVVGEINPLTDIADPDRPTLSALLQELGTFSAFGFLSSAKKTFTGAGIKPVTLSTFFPHFGIQSTSRAARACEIENMRTLQKLVMAQKQPTLMDSAVFSNGDRIALEETGGTDKMLLSFLEKSKGDHSDLSLVKAAIPGLGALAPPVIGPKTVNLCYAAGIARIITSGEFTILAEPDKFFKLVDETGVELITV